jgi:Na+-transporting methylmalonyl-CoA/oxaloacetate decarboxylase gamma subunit
MSRRSLCFLCSVLCLLCSVFSVFGQAQEQKQPEAAQAQPEAAPKQTEEAQPKKDEDGKLISVPGGKALGMSILGNQEAPKALVIVPWKRSELGNVVGISTMLDDSRQPIDKEVFMRNLSYYEIRSETTRPVGAPAEKNAAQPNTAVQRRK